MSFLRNYALKMLTGTGLLFLLLFVFVMTGLADMVLSSIEAWREDIVADAKEVSVSPDGAGDEVLVGDTGVTARAANLGSQGGGVGGEAYWRLRGTRYALQGDEKGLIAIVIDDVGPNRKAGYRASRLPQPITVSLLPYGRYSPLLAEVAHKRGHDVFVHLPMEPEDSTLNPGRMALRRDLEDDDITARTLWNLTRFDHVVGVNNHMGSSFTLWSHGMGIFLEELERSGLMFLDSMTNVGSKGWQVASNQGIPHLRRDVFLDHDPSVEAIKASLVELEELSSRRGYAVGIGHPYSETLAILETWMLDAASRGFVFVPVSTLTLAKEQGYIADSG